MNDSGYIRRRRQLPVVDKYQHPDIFRIKNRPTQFKVFTSFGKERRLVVTTLNDDSFAPNPLISRPK